MDTPLLELFKGFTVAHLVIGMIASILIAWISTAVVGLIWHGTKRIFFGRGAR